MMPGPKKILLVEDNPADALLIREMLAAERRDQFDLDWSDGLNKALGRLNREPFDTILLDMMLPDSRGFETIERLLDSAPAIPIVVVTGAEDEQMAIKAILRGAQDYLVKGTFNGRELARTILYAIERKRAESANSYLASIVESSEDAIIGKRLDGTITSWNSGAEKIFGYSAKEVIGSPISILAPPDRLDEVTDVLDRIRRGERIAPYETQQIRNDGQPIHLSVTVSPIKERGGRVIGVSAIARDITERKRIREEREKLVCQLQEALSRVKQLSGLLPICANCKKIRDDKGYWNQIEKYISEHSEAEFTHGICPSCVVQLYPELGPPPED